MADTAHDDPRAWTVGAGYRSAVTSPAGPRLERLGALAVLGFCVLRWGLGGLGPNASDVLVQARQQVDPAWLPHDAAAIADVPYRWLFEVLAGPALEALGMDIGALVLRLLLCLLAAPALARLLRQAGVHPALWVPAVALLGAAPSIGAGAWMLLAAEAKCAAWIAGVAAVVLGVEGRDRAAAAAMGLAVGLHVLVGGGLLLGAGLALMLAGGGARLRALPWAVVPALPGLAAVGGYLGSGQGGLPPDEAAALARLYVEGRMAHHLLPDHFADGWLARLGGASLGLAWLWRSRGEARALAAVGLGVAPLALVGLSLWGADAIPLLRFHWFRVPDALWMALGWVGLLALASRLPRAAWVGGGLSVGLLLMPRAFEGRRAAVWDHVARGMTPAVSPRHACVAEHVPSGGRVLADPTDAALTLRTGRARVVSFKQAPHAERDLASWAARLEATSGGMVLRGGLGSRPALQAGWRRLGWEERLRVAGVHGAGFVLVRAERAAPDVSAVCLGDGWGLYAAGSE